MDGQPTWTDCDEAGDYVVPNVLSPRDLVFRPDNMEETVPHIWQSCDRPHTRNGPEKILCMVAQKCHHLVFCDYKNYIF